MMDNCDVPNTSGKTAVMRIFMPDGTIRSIKISNYSDIWITGVCHGKYADVIASGNGNGSSSTYYCDKHYFSSAASRVVFRGGSYAYSGGGVSFTFANYGASHSYSDIGSRLAFRGKIVKASSAARYQAVSEIA